MAALRCYSAKLWWVWRGLAMTLWKVERLYWSTQWPDAPWCWNIYLNVDNIAYMEHLGMFCQCEHDIRWFAVVFPKDRGRTLIFSGTWGNKCSANQRAFLQDGPVTGLRTITVKVPASGQVEFRIFKNWTLWLWWEKCWMTWTKPRIIYLGKLYITTEPCSPSLESWSIRGIKPKWPNMSG